MLALKDSLLPLQGIGSKFLQLSEDRMAVETDRR